MKVAIIYRVDSANKLHKPVRHMQVSNGNAWQEMKHEADMFYIEGDHWMMNNEKVAKHDGTKLSLLFYFKEIKRLFKGHTYDVVIVMHTALSFGLNDFCIYLKSQYPNTKCILEVQTYPYLYEYPLLKRALAWLAVPRNLTKSCDAALHLGSESEVLNLPTIPSLNAINSEEVTPKTIFASDRNHLKLILVANLWPWHNIASLINAIASYNSEISKFKVTLTIIGEGPEKENLIQISNILGSSTHIQFLGAKYDEELTSIFNNHDIAIGNIAVSLQQKGYCQSLKHRHYAARGIPFVFNTEDKSFITHSSCLYYPNPTVDKKMIEEIVSWYLANQNTLEQKGKDLRSFALISLTWKENVKQIIRFVANNKS